MHEKKYAILEGKTVMNSLFGNISGGEMDGVSGILSTSRGERVRFMNRRQPCSARQTQIRFVSSIVPVSPVSWQASGVPYSQ